MKKQKYKLTDKQRAFCHEYIIDWNGSRACIKAGYSKKTARIQASQLLTKLNIQKYISDIQEDMAKEAGMSMLMMLFELKKMALSNIADMHETWIKRTDFEQLTKEQRSCISEISTKIKTYLDKQGNNIEEEFIKIKLHDKTKAIQEINKMLGYYSPEKTDITSGGEKINQPTQVIFKNARKKK